MAETTTVYYKSGTSDKQYSVTVIEPDCPEYEYSRPEYAPHNSWRVLFSWGRRGAVNPQQKVEAAYNERRARVIAAEKLAEKRAKGYREEQAEPRRAQNGMPLCPRCGELMLPRHIGGNCNACQIAEMPPCSMPGCSLSSAPGTDKCYEHNRELRNAAIEAERQERRRIPTRQPMRSGPLAACFVCGSTYNCSHRETELTPRRQTLRERIQAENQQREPIPEPPAPPAPARRIQANPALKRNS